MDALKLYGKRFFIVDVLSQLESYNVRYNQFDNTTFRLDWFFWVSWTGFLPQTWKMRL